ncbi:MAG: sulfotransferase domain-containing protein [Bacteroidota bacterium]
MANSIYYFFVLLGTVIFCVGIVLLLKKPFYNLAVAAVRQLDIIFNKSLSEEEKDQKIIGNLSSLLKYLFVTVGLVFVLFVGSLIPVILYVKYQADFEPDTTSIFFYLSMFLGSFVLLFFRNKSDYSYWSKLLHTLVLDNYQLGKYLFEKEIKKYNGEKINQERNFVIVTGLARAGTTALTNLMYDPKVFHSIDYSYVPFLLAPKFWKKIYNPKNVKKRERAHGDKVLFSENSIEALEEYFFKVHLSDGYIKGDSLVMHEVSPEILERYYKYQDLFKSSAQTVYLAKNNNFILRYESVKRQNNQFKMVLIFRDPLSHARSLLNQHRNFIERQSEDGFVLSYMNWLGHYEFGLNQKHFDFGQGFDRENYEADELSYWLAIWCNYHASILEVLDNDNVVLVDYEDLLNRPEGLKARLSSKLGITMAKGSIDQFVPKKKADVDTQNINNDLLDKAASIHQKLLAKKAETV